MGYDREKMKEDLLNRTKASYERREGDTGNRYFDPDAEIKFWKPQPTKGKPHVIDIIPFVAGPNHPTKVSSPTREGTFAYVLELFVHKNVGPGKAQVVCPAKNYGNRCPICEEIDDLVRDGVEYEDIKFVAKRQCAYNVLVMDTADTEAQGVQVWDVSYRFSEKAISGIAQDRKGGYIPFANPDQRLGRSLMIDVDSDKYKTISGHRFELRDYDIPDEILDDAKVLDKLIKIYTYEELSTLLYGEGGKPEGETKEEGRRRSLRGQSKYKKEEPASEGRGVGRMSRQPKEEDSNPCPIGAVYPDDFDKYGECADCPERQKCAEALDMKEYKASKEAPKEEPKKTEATANPPRRTLLRRS